MIAAEHINSLIRALEQQNMTLPELSLHLTGSDKPTSQMRRLCKQLVEDELLISKNGHSRQPEYALKSGPSPCACGSPLPIIERLARPDRGYLIRCSSDRCPAKVKRKNAYDTIEQWNVMSYR